MHVLLGADSNQSTCTAVAAQSNRLRERNRMGQTISAVRQMVLRMLGCGCLPYPSVHRAICLVCRNCLPHTHKSCNTSSYCKGSCCNGQAHNKNKELWHTRTCCIDLYCTLNPDLWLSTYFLLGPLITNILCLFASLLLCFWR